MNNQMPKNPYPGLRPFEFAENHLFFGREGQSETILSRLQTSRFVAVVGTSGSGKSSLVRAGLLPLLYGGFMGAVGSRWRVAMFRPGNNPIHNLAAALVAPSEFAPASPMPTDFAGGEEKSKIAFTETILRRSAVGLRECARGADFASNENLLVVVDQFEEIFRFTKEASAHSGANGSKPPERTGNEAAAFIKLLLEAVHDETTRVYVVITMRSDFLGDCAQFRDLPEAINDGQYLIPRLTREQLRRVIESPAKVRRVQISPALATRLLNDIEDDQDQLPVLQHTLMRTWDKWAGKFELEAEIGLADYEAAGKFTDALSLHADEAFSELGGESLTEFSQSAAEPVETSLPLSRRQQIAAKLFKCLTETDAENRVTRRVVTVGELCKISYAELEEVLSVVETFRRDGRTFLMPPPKLSLDEQSLIDISHESLIRKWSELGKWVVEEAEAAQTYRRLADDAFQYKKGRTALLTDPELSNALKWRDEFKPNEAWVQIYGKTWGRQPLSSYEETLKYLEESQKDSELKKIQENERRRQEFEFEEKNKKIAQLEAERELLKQSEIDFQNAISKREQELKLSQEEIEKIKGDRQNLKMDEAQLKAEIKELENRLAAIRKQETDIGKILSSDAKRGEQIKIENFYLPEAKDVLRGKVLTPKEMLDLAKKLKSVKAFNYARRILARAAADSTLKQGSPLKLKIHQEWSLCTYKDSDSPADARLDKALDILCDVEDLATTTNQETLGLAGAIYKRKWEIDNQKLQLERALLHYERGYREGAASDQGYTGINAAFVLDLLANQEEEAAKKVNSTSAIGGERKAQARFIRENLIETLPPLIEREETRWLAEMWWFYSTVAEAYFGLKRYDEAIEWLNRGKERIERIPDWEIESTINQLARLAIVQCDTNLSGDEFQNTPAWSALEKFFGNNTAAVRSAFVGKIGLALSGGGFRASLFHIGMLAKLAELDVLRQVEVLSCVSGGSIIGAHYYLEVRHLLQSKTDTEITKQDYINIVRRIEKDFLAGVQRNVRMRIAADPITNLRMIFSSAYSRSMRAGELYEEEIFSRIKDGEDDKPRYLNELNIYPKGEGQDFAPKLYNWRRTAKAPILILNATTLNTGHNWQFTTTWMGEPPSSIDVEVDTNDQLRRMYYTEAPEQHRKIRLGHAVSASAAVPGIFEPLSLENLYPDRIVRLADGGGTDNQGLGGLLEQDCTVVLISDGSGQMESQNTPSSGTFGVLLRSSTILQSRIRDVQYHDLERRKRSSLLRGLMFIHLKEDLNSDPIDWVDCLDPFAGSIDARPPSRRGILTRYGIAKEIQTRLAGIRTDLDSFTDVEAYTLMTSAYRMTEDAFVNTKCVDGVSGTGEPVKWKFLNVEEAMKGTGKKYQHIKNLLDTSGMMAFKIWKQSPPLKYAAWILGLALVAVLGWGFITYSQLVIVEPITLGGAGKWILGFIFPFVAAYLVGWLVEIVRQRKTLNLLIMNVHWREVLYLPKKLFAREPTSPLKSVRWRETLMRVVFGAVMSIFGWLVARLHLHVFDRLFLRRGSLDTLRR